MPWHQYVTRRIGRHFADDILESIFVNENIHISVKCLGKMWFTLHLHWSRGWFGNYLSQQWPISLSYMHHPASMSLKDKLFCTMHWCGYKIDYKGLMWPFVNIFRILSVAMDTSKWSCRQWSGPLGMQYVLKHNKTLQNVNIFQRMKCTRALATRPSPCCLDIDYARHITEEERNIYLWPRASIHYSGLTTVLDL